MTKWISVDVESDGHCPGTDMYSMISLGAVVVDRNLDKTFYAEFAPISKIWIPEALAVSRISREQHEAYPTPYLGAEAFAEWLRNIGEQVIFVSDNPAFDWQFVNYYLHKYVGRNPFGFSGRRIGDIYSGLVKDVRRASEWKKHRITKHTHNPVDDAKGNAEALIWMHDNLGLNVSL